MKETSKNTPSIKKEEFIELINKNKLKLYKTAISILKNDEDANDAIQETLYKAYKNIETLREERYFTTWTIRILINKCYDIIKENKKVVYVDDKITENTQSYYDTYKIESSLERILNKLDDDLRKVIVLYYYDDLSVVEISNILLIPEGTVKSRLARARNKIFKLIKEEEGDI